jgi:hypothetical protein
MIFRRVTLINWLKEFFDYKDGHLIWKKKRHYNSRVNIGDIAGCLYNNGYVVVSFNSKRYLLHRLVWYWFHERWPENEIDHVNGITTDNRIENLREATRGENAQNIRRKSKNSIGLRGVQQVGNKFRARIGVKGKVLFLNCRETPEEAFEDYKSAKSKYHKFEPSL